MLQPTITTFRERRTRFANSKKTIYSLKQFPRALFGKFNTDVAYYGLRQSSFDHSIFVRYFSIITITLAVYVEDIAIRDDD